MPWNYLIAGHGNDTSKYAKKEIIKYFALLKNRVSHAIDDVDAFSELEFYEEE
jgi:hypothetical protein